MSDSLGGARGRVTIDTSQLAQAQAHAQAFAVAMERAFAGINPNVKRAEKSLDSLSSSLSRLAGVVGLNFGAQGLAQFGRFAVESDRIATAFARQSVAALNLAGSQEKLNDLLLVYERATGGVIDRATALADVTRLQAIGFADTSAELERFARAARGISVAMGVSQDYVISQLTLAIANQSFMRLDQIGLDAGEAKKAIDALKASDKSLTDAMVYQQVIMEQAEKKFGALADSAVAQATGAEKAAKALKDLRLEFGQLTGGTVGGIMSGLVDELDGVADSAHRLIDEIERLKDVFDFDIELPAWMKWDPTDAFLDWVEPRKNTSGTTPWGNRGAPPKFTPPAAATPRFREDQLDAILDWSQGVQEIERQAANDRLDATRQYESQRSNTIRDYEKSIAREAQDFALSRLRAEQDLAKSILDVHRDAARREEAQAEDLSRNLAQARGDSDERIADARKDANERIAEMEEDYARNRARAQEDHRDKLMSAAGRLDAIAILEERKRFARQSNDAKEAHDDQRKDLQKQLDERIDDERKTLDKSTRQAQEAHDRQLEDARKADEQRIADMQADFELRKAREDEDRGIRLERMAVDHNDQLAEMARAHADRIKQIQVHAQEERTQLDSDFREKLAELGIQTEAWAAEQKKIADIAIEQFDRWWRHIMYAVAMPAGGGTLPTTPQRIEPGMGDALMGISTSGRMFIPPQASGGGGGNRSITLGDINVSIGGTTNASAADIAYLVRQEVVTILEEVAA